MNRGKAFELLKPAPQRSCVRLISGCESGGCSDYSIVTLHDLVDWKTLLADKCHQSPLIIMRGLFSKHSSDDLKSQVEAGRQLKTQLANTNEELADPSCSERGWSAPASD